MITLWNWIKRWSWVGFVVLGALVMILLRRRAMPGTKVDEAIAAAKADAETEKVLAAQGHEAALKAVEEKYASAKTALEEHERAEADELRKDPRALARFLAKVSTRRRSADAGRAR